MAGRLPLQNQFSNAVGSETGLSIDYKRVLYHVYRYWYFVLLSLLVSLTIAFLRNRYATRIFPVTASIIIKEKEESSEGKLLYNNPLVNFYQNYLNELYIVKSYPLMKKTVANLNFQATFYKEGNILTTEIYRTLPIEVKVINEGDISRPFSVEFTILSNSKFNISQRNNDGSIISQQHNFNDTTWLNGVLFKFVALSSSLENQIGDPLIFSFTPSGILARGYISRLKAEWAEEGSGVIDLSINGSIPQKEIDLLNGLIKEYEEYNLIKKSSAATRTIEFITGQLDQITDSLKNAERELELFKDKNIVTDLNTEALRLYTKVEVLETQKTELTLRTNYYKYLLKYLGEGKNLDQIILPSSVGISDNILAGLISKMVDYQLEMKMLVSPEKLDNPLVNDRRGRIREIKSDIIESINNQRGVDSITMDFLKHGISDIEKQLDRLPQAERKLVSIKRNYSLMENLYVFLLQKRAEAGISKAATTSDVVVVNPPLTGGFVSPRTILNYLIGLSAGIALPLLIFIGIEITNTKVQSRDDIEEFTDMPVLGGTGRKKSFNNLEVMSKLKSPVAESFRALRSNLLYFVQNKEKGAFLVTSSISGEGKTFNSINLASVFALSGKRTLIIGADMRKPKIFEDFELANNVGLSSYLAGLNEFEETIQATTYENLYMVSGGPVPPNPSELLISPKMGEFMRLCKKEFDIVIIDSPPLVIVADAFELTQYVDHTLFVVRQDYTPKVLLRTINDFYQSGKLSKISIVLNDIYRSGLGYGYGYGYAYGYGYGYGYGSKKKTIGGYYED